MIRLQREPFSVEEITGALRSDGCGSIVTFTGIVRGNSRSGESVEAIEWDVYPAMALREMQAIRAVFMERHGLLDAAIVHRYGVHPAGEPLVLIAVSSAHRKEGFKACAGIMDAIKQRVPLWKKEIRSDGTTAWIEG